MEILETCGYCGRGVFHCICVEGPRDKEDVVKDMAFLNDRGREYGDFTKQGEIAQALKGVARSGPSWITMEGHQREAIDMILHKISRIVNGNPNNEDSWKDIEGYARITRERIG